MTATSEPEIADVKALLDMGTGTFLTMTPWCVERVHEGHGYYRGIVYGGANGEYVIADCDLPPTADLIAHAPVLAERVLALVDAQRSMAEALVEVTSCLYDVWRCNTDEERRFHGQHIAILCDRFLKHPSRIVDDFAPARSVFPVGDTDEKENRDA